MFSPPHNLLDLLFVFWTYDIIVIGISATLYSFHVQSTAQLIGSSLCILNIWYYCYRYFCNFVIQIKICAEYRDMLPRPRLVCQEPGLRLIGRSPGVPDKSSRGLGSMSRYSAQILICFIAYIFLIFFIPLWVWLGTLQDCQYAQFPLPLSIVIRMRLVIRQSKLPACLAEVQLGHQNTLWHLSHSLVKMTDKVDEICINRKFSAQEPSEWRDFSMPVSNFIVFQPRI